MSTSKVESHLTDARVHMLTNPKEYDVVCIQFPKFFILLLTVLLC